ncbi:hypothetical protein SALBM135S_00047 [Streptomyces alboniger]
MGDSRIGGPLRRILVSVATAIAVGLVAGLLILVGGTAFADSAMYAGWTALIWIPVIFVGALLYDTYKRRRSCSM